MKIGRILSAAMILAVSGSLSLAHAAFILTFDENGNGSYQLYNGTDYDPSVNDPGFIDSNGFLVYALPEPVGEGDVAILEPVTEALSDGLRFFNISIEGQLFGFMEYFSDKTDGVDALADTGFPTDFNPVVSVTETGPEGNNSFQFVAGPGDPAITNFYNGVSDATVPEPTTMALLGGALFALGALRRRSS